MSPDESLDDALGPHGAGGFDEDGVVGLKGVEDRSSRFACVRGDDDVNAEECGSLRDSIGETAARHEKSDSRLRYGRANRVMLFSLGGTDSFISPRTATRRPRASSTNASRDARTLVGFAL